MGSGPTYVRSKEMIAQEDLMDLGIILFKRMGKEDLKELGSLACLFFHVRLKTTCWALIFVLEAFRR